ncbi:hypothetical protein RU639_013578 [Aspergillus parasiticus]
MLALLCGVVGKIFNCPPLFLLLCFVQSTIKSAYQLKMKDELIIAVIGSAATGKSTLVDRLVTLVGGSCTDEELAMFQMETPKYNVTLYDIPDIESFREYTENGTINPNSAILCVSAAAGEGTHEGNDKTPEYIAVAMELGIPQLAVAITKMDKALWLEERLNEMIKVTTTVVRHTKPTILDIRSIVYVPVCAQLDDLLMSETEHMSWYKGWTKGTVNDYIIKGIE